MPRGRPLIVASRLPAGVDTPGRKLTKSIALRDVNGSFVICVLVTVDDTVGDVVCTISDDDVTVTCSVSPPTSRVARTLAGEPAVMTTLLTTTVLNPCRDTVTVYEPEFMFGNENDPSALVMDSCDTPVALCLIDTFAPGTMPPVSSVTLPEMVEVTPPCPNAEVARINERSRVETAAKDRRATRVALDQDGCVPVGSRQMGTNSRLPVTDGYQAGANYRVGATLSMNVTRDSWEWGLGWGSEFLTTPRSPLTTQALGTRSARRCASCAARAPRSGAGTPCPS